MHLESPQIADKFIREQVNEILRGRELYKLGNHGWLNEEDIDPEQIGHAMWQLDDPADEVLELLWEEQASQELAGWKALCSVAGADFEGLMNGVRLSIGLSLFQLERVGESIDADDGLATIHLRSAIVALGSASERLRQYFIAGVFRKSPGEYSGNDRKKRLYATPFLDAIQQCRDVSEIHARLVGLETIASKVVTFEKTRNFIVHQIATQMGRLRADAIESARMPFDGGAFERFSSADLATLTARAEADEKEKTAAAIQMPINWYKLLIDMAESVFCIENRLRRAWP